VGVKRRKATFKRWKAEKNEWNAEKELNRRGGIWRNLEDPAEKGEMAGKCFRIRTLLIKTLEAPFTLSFKWFSWC
jgi:hypothetical protein